MSDPLLIVIVLYRCKIMESSTFRSLCAAIRKVGSRNIHLLVWDNSPDCSEDDLIEINSELKVLFKEVRQVRDPCNPGLVAAYNAAWSQAELAGIEWILTLDQDTQIPERYLNEFDFSRRRLISNALVAAWVPRVEERALSCSPVRFLAGLPWAFLPVREPGIADVPISAINSGAFVSVPFLSSIGGYSSRFRLDYVDHWLCQTIYLNKWRIGVMDITIEHQLSVNCFQNRVSLQRYRSILEAQTEFAISSPTFAAPLTLLLLLPFHAIIVFFKGRNTKFCGEAFRQWLILLRRWPLWLVTRDLR